MRVPKFLPFILVIIAGTLLAIIMLSTKEVEDLNKLGQPDSSKGRSRIDSVLDDFGDKGLTHRSPVKNFTIRANEEISFQIVVNPSPTVNFVVTAQRAGLEFYLTDPRGKRIDKPTSPMRDVEFSEEENPVGIFSVYSVKNPKPGTWTLGVRGTYSGEGSLFAIFDDDISLQILTEEFEAPANGIIKVQTRFMRGENPITNAKINGLFRVESDSQWHDESEVILSDEGKNQDERSHDGIYTGIYQLRQPNQRYVVTVNASSGVIVRQANTEFRLANKAIATITVSHEELLEQENDHNYLDLALEVGIQLNRRGNYQFTGILTDLQNNYVATATTSSVVDGRGMLDAGLQRVNLHFYGQDIWQRQRSGPYKLTVVIDCYDEQIVTYPCARYDDVFVTKVYQWQSFKKED